MMFDTTTFPKKIKFNDITLVIEPKRIYCKVLVSRALALPDPHNRSFVEKDLNKIGSLKFRIENNPYWVLSQDEDSYWLEKNIEDKNVSFNTILESFNNLLREIHK